MSQSSSSLPSLFRGGGGSPYLAKKIIRPQDIVLGTIWLGPGSGTGVNGNGTHPDLGQENANEVIRRALEIGIVEFDTAPWYGAGAAEERLGRALVHHHHHHHHHHELFQQTTTPTATLNTAAAATTTTGGGVILDEKIKVGTKVGRIFWEEATATAALAGFDDPGRSPLSSRICHNDYTASGTQISLEHSLNRLGLARVDTVRIHDPNDNSNNNRRRQSTATTSSSGTNDGFVDEVAQALSIPGGMIEELRAMRERGVIQNVGLGMNTNKEDHMGSPEDVLRLLRGAPSGAFDSALLAGGWNLLCQSGWECILECQNRQIQVHAAGIFASGFLADDNKAYAYNSIVPRHLQTRRRQWSKLAQTHSLSLPSLAIGFAALPIAVTRLVIGVATVTELEQILSWVEESNTIPESLWVEAAEMGLWQINNHVEE